MPPDAGSAGAIKTCNNDLNQMKHERDRTRGFQWIDCETDLAEKCRRHTDPTADKFRFSYPRLKQEQFSVSPHYKGVGRSFQRGAHCVKMRVGCLLEKGLQKGEATGTPGPP